MPEFNKRPGRFFRKIRYSMIWRSFKKQSRPFWGRFHVFLKPMWRWNFLGLYFISGANVAASFELLRKYQPRGPLVNTEFYTGWLDNWGKPHQTRKPEKVADYLDQVLKLNASVNMYMFEGGTNFGFMNGTFLHCLDWRWYVTFSRLVGSFIGRPFGRWYEHNKSRVFDFHFFFIFIFSFVCLYILYVMSLWLFFLIFIYQLIWFVQRKLMMLYFGFRSQL